MLWSLLRAPLRSIIFSIKKLFEMDMVTGMASVELWVVLTTVLLVVRFVLDFFGPWYANRSMLGVVLTIEMLNYSMVHYTLGLMQLSAATVNDYFQVWAVLLVTLQYSVKIGRPYSRSKQIPLLDLMSSFWTANLLRVQTFYLLRIPLWLIWAINAARIICYFSSSDKAEAINQENMRLVSDYMRYEHTLGDHPGDAADPDKEFAMKWYKYLVLGEDQALKRVQEKETKSSLKRVQQKETKPYNIQLDPDEHEDVITVEKIWNIDAGERRLLGDDDKANKLKDVCLSFALYKLLRRRFYDLPIHEAGRSPRQEKIQRLVFKYIAESHERAFRVAAVEMSFLQDLFYSKHAAMFAGGFPFMSLLLSLSLIAATGYVAYPVRYIPGRMDQADRNRITHGVLITRLIVALIVGKEVAEIYIYVFSQWTKVLMLCCCARWRCSLVVMVARWVLSLMTRGRWDERIRQHNILISVRGVKVAKATLHLVSKFPMSIKLEECTKKAILESFKILEGNPERLDSYFSIAFGSNEERMQQLTWAVLEHKADTHRILLWHIATSLCEIDLSSDKAAELKTTRLPPRPFVKKPQGAPEDDAEAPKWWEHYTTAASLSNYCGYLVTQSLVPDNGIVATKVFMEVRREINCVTLDGKIGSLFRFRSMRDVYNRLMAIVENASDEAGPEQGQDQDGDEDEPDEEAPEGEPTSKTSEPKKRDILDIKNSLTKKGAKLGKQLLEAYKDKEDREGLWRDLSVFWTGMLLHLAATTRASKHRTRLAGSRELVTHLWALLSHAGFLGIASHGQQLLDPEDLQDVNPLS